MRVPGAALTDAAARARAAGSGPAWAGHGAIIAIGSTAATAGKLQRTKHGGRRVTSATSSRVSQPPTSGSQRGGHYDAQSPAGPDLRALRTQRRPQVRPQRRRVALCSECRSRAAMCRAPSSAQLPRRRPADHRTAWGASMSRRASGQRPPCMVAAHYRCQSPAATAKIS